MKGACRAFPASGGQPSRTPWSPRARVLDGLLTGAVAMVLLLVVTARSSGASAVAPVRIGLLLPPDEPDRVAIRRGAELALERFRTLARDVPGAELELVIRGRPGQWGDDGDEAGRLVLDDGVQVLIAPPGGAATHLALQVAGRTRTPVVTLCPDGSVTGAGIPWLTRVGPTTADEARTLLGLGSRWVAWTTGDRSGREAGRDLERAAAGAGKRLEVRVATDGIGILDLPGDVDGALLWLPRGTVLEAVETMRRRSWRGVVGVPARLITGAFGRELGTNAVGVRAAEMDPGAGKETEAGRRSFAARHRERFGAEPEPVTWLAADALGLAREWELQRRRTGSPSTPVRPDAGRLGRGFTGEWEFKGTGDRRCRLRVVGWEGGSWRAVQE